MTLTGFITGGAAKWIGGANRVFGNARLFDVGRFVAHGFVGGVANVIRGGKFGTGFTSSFFTKMVSQPIQGYAESLAGTAGALSDILGASAAALVGGTASVLGGGKFANGAQTAAIQYLFNQIGDHAKQRRDQRLNQRANYAEQRRENLELMNFLQLTNYIKVIVNVLLK